MLWLLSKNMAKYTAFGSFTIEIKVPIEAIMKIAIN
jgi:hypothetical protein